MKHHRPRNNYLRAYRKRSGLSQRELAKLLGYNDAGQVSRHERAASNPPLSAALAYEAIFRAPIASIFAGMQADVVRDIEVKLKEIKLTLESVASRPSNASLVAQKLAWLGGRERPKGSR